MQRVCVKKASLVKCGYKDFEDWASHPDHLYIGRNMSFYVKGAVASPLANPFPVKKYGREECLKMYKKHIKSSQQLLDLIDILGQYKEIGCWCTKDEDCHGNLLINLYHERN